MGKYSFGFRLSLVFLALGLGLVPALAQGIIPPSDVESLTAETGDQSVTLNWSAASDDGLITEYKIYFDTKSLENSYLSEILVDGNQTSYTINNLVDGMTYYFAVTALDDQGNESVNYSPEVEATPGSALTNAPEVIAAQHLAPNQILVTMSVPVKADSLTDSFTIYDEDDQLFLITNTEINGTDVLLTLAKPLSAGLRYKIMATTGITNLANQPVSSGITDTIELLAQDSFAEPESVETESMVETPLPAEEVVIDAPVMKPEIQPALESLVIDDQSFIDQLIENGSLLDPELKLVNLEEPTKSSAPDNLAPADATNLAANTAETPAEGKIRLTWTTAPDTDGDIADQILFTRIGLGAWDTGYSLGKDVNEMEIDVDQDQNYQVRLVTVDQSGNQSYGASLSFSTKLAESGTSTTGLFAITGAILLGLFFLFGSRRA